MSRETRRAREIREEEERTERLNTSYARVHKKQCNYTSGFVKINT